MNKKLVVKQEEISDCGVCSLLSIIRYYHGNTSLESLRISSLTSNDGVTAYNLINCAIEYGFDAVGVILDKIPVDQLPCIAHIRINESLSHFMVIYSVKNDTDDVLTEVYFDEDLFEDKTIKEICDIYKNGAIIVASKTDNLPGNIQDYLVIDSQDNAIKFMGCDKDIIERAKAYL